MQPDNSSRKTVYSQINALQHLKKGWTPDNKGEKISRTALKLAASIFSSTNTIYPLGEPPDIAPQEDGGVIMYWMGPFQATHVMISPQGIIFMTNLSLGSQEVDEYHTTEIDEAVNFLQDVLRKFTRGN